MLILRDIKDKLKDHPVFFVHIPKNAGTSLGTQVPWATSTGHAHPLVITPKWGQKYSNNLTFAIFRDPWDRMVSLCEYIRATHPSDRHLLERFVWTSTPTFNTDKVGLMRRFLEQLFAEKNAPKKFSGSRYNDADVDGNTGLWACIAVARQQVSWLIQPEIDMSLLHTHAAAISDWAPEKVRGMFVWKILHDQGQGFNTEGDWCVDVVLRCDELDKDLAEFAKLAGKPSINIGKSNVTTGRGNTAVYFNGFNDTLFKSMFGEDIAFWRKMGGNDLSVSM